jgi:tetratricopeptide (TPR) repeat protein
MMHTQGIRAIRTGRERARRRAVAAILSLALTCSGAARAEGDTQAEARAAFARGYALTQEGRYEEAIADFTHAYRISPHYAVLYNLGQAYAAAGRPGQAADALKRYLAEGGSKVPAARRRQVEADIAAQERRVAAAPASAPMPPASDPVGARAPIAAPADPPPPPAAAAAGISAATPSWSPDSPSLTVAADPAFAGQAHLTAPAVSTPIRAGDPGPPDTQGSRARRIAGLTVAGAGVVAGGVAAALYLWNRDRYQRWSSRHDEIAKNTPPSPERDDRQRDNDDLARSIRTTSVVNVSFAIASAALLATGAVLYVTGSRRGDAATSTVQTIGLGPGIVDWRVAF